MNDEMTCIHCGVDIDDENYGCVVNFGKHLGYTLCKDCETKDREDANNYEHVEDGCVTRYAYGRYLAVSPDKPTGLSGDLLSPDDKMILFGHNHGSMDKWLEVQPIIEAEWDEVYEDMADICVDGMEELSVLDIIETLREEKIYPRAEVMIGASPGDSTIAGIWVKKEDKEDLIKWATWVYPIWKKMKS